MESGFWQFGMDIKKKCNEYEMKEAKMTPQNEAQMNEDVTIKELEDKVKNLQVKLNTCKHDYWFMTNLLEKFSTDKDQAIKDCIERMKFRKPLFGDQP